MDKRTYSSHRLLEKQVEIFNDTVTQLPNMNLLYIQERLDKTSTNLLGEAKQILCKLTRNTWYKLV